MPGRRADEHRVLSDAEAIDMTRRRIDEMQGALRAIRQLIPSRSEERDGMLRTALVALDEAKSDTRIVSADRFTQIARALMTGGRLLLATYDLAVEMRPEDNDRAFDRVTRWIDQNRELAMGMGRLAMSADLRLIRE